MVYLTGDIHARMDDRYEFFKSLKEDDILIVLGDFGFFFNWSLIDQWNNYNFKFTTICVLGNHENYSILDLFQKDEIFGAKCRKMNDKTFIINNGEILNIDNKKIFVFGGALSIDRAYRIPYISWWPEEQPNGNDYKNAIDNLSKIDYNIDYFLAHDVNRDIAKKIFGLDNVIDSSTSNMLAQLEFEIKSNNGIPYEYFFGHWHKYGVLEGENVKYNCLYSEVYCLDTSEILFF